MDSNATVDELSRLILLSEPGDKSSEDRAERARELTEALIGWMDRGGFPPDSQRVRDLALCLNRMVSDFWEG
jgi:hypothetical protein